MLLKELLALNKAAEASANDMVQESKELKFTNKTEWEKAAKKLKITLIAPSSASSNEIHMFAERGDKKRAEWVATWNKKTGKGDIETGTSGYPNPVAYERIFKQLIKGAKNVGSKSDGPEVKIHWDNSSLEIPRTEKSAFENAVKKKHKDVSFDWGSERVNVSFNDID